MESPGSEYIPAPPPDLVTLPSWLVLSVGYGAVRAVLCWKGLSNFSICCPSLSQQSHMQHKPEFPKFLCVTRDPQEVDVFSYLNILKWLSFFFFFLSKMTENQPDKRVDARGLPGAGYIECAITAFYDVPDSIQTAH